MAFPFYTSPWNPASIVGAQLTCPSPFRTASVAGTSSLDNNGIRSLATIPNTGLVTVIFTVNRQPDLFFSLGICNAAFSLGVTLGTDSGKNSLGFNLFGLAAGIYIGGNLVGDTLSSSATGTFILLALNMSSRRAWLYYSDNGKWNTVDPNTPFFNVGGIDISTLSAGPYYVGCSIVDSISPGVSLSILAKPPLVPAVPFIMNQVA